MSQLERLIAIDRELRKGYFPTVHILCEMFEVKPRTIYDDIKKLRDSLGIDVTYDYFRKGYYNANPAKTLPMFDLTETELSMLALGTKMLGQHTRSLVPELSASLDKIYSRVPESVGRASLESVASVAFVPPAVAPVSKRKLAELKRAIRSKNLLSMSYCSPGSPVATKRIVEPYRLVQHLGTWYLVSFCLMRQAPRLFALQRIIDYKILEEHFEDRKDVDVDDWFNRAFQIENRGREWAVSILFLAPCSFYIKEKLWHRDQRLDEHPDGSCILHFKTLSLEEVKRWIMYHGAGAIVLEPRELVAMVKNEFESALRRYDHDGS